MDTFLRLLYHDVKFLCQVVRLLMLLELRMIISKRTGLHGEYWMVLIL